jgi:hypothetical protein
LRRGRIEAKVSHWTRWRIAERKNAKRRKAGDVDESFRNLNFFVTSSRRKTRVPVSALSLARDDAGPAIMTVIVVVGVGRVAYSSIIRN